MLAGMAPASGPELCAAVSNAGGIGTLAAIDLTPRGLRAAIRRIRQLAPGKPMGVDLLLPKIGQGARATNKDYTKGLLGELVDIMVEESVDLFVSAVGVPPRWAVKRLQENGTRVMNMVGSPRHVQRAIDAGCDIICAQGTEAGGHTGDITSLVLLPQVVDLCRPSGTLVVAAGGICDGRSIAAALAIGADGVWCGSRFLVTPEANVPLGYKQALLKASSGDTMRTPVFTGRPVRVLKSEYAKEYDRTEELETLLKNGIIPFRRDVKAGRFGTAAPRMARFGDEWVDLRQIPGASMWPHLGTSAPAVVAVGQSVGMLREIQPAGDVFRRLVKETLLALQRLRDHVSTHNSQGKDEPLSLSRL